MKTRLLLLLITFSLLGHSQSLVDSIPNPQKLDARNYVSNPSGILSSSTVSEINTELDLLRQKTDIEVAIVAVQSIGEANIESFAVDLFKKWGIGKAKADNGLLVLFVLDQKKIKFETGYGIEGVLPDAICKRIQMEDMVPEFKTGNYDAGILAGTKRLVSILKNEKPAAKVQQPTIDWTFASSIAIAAYLLLALICFIWVNQTTVQIQKNSKYRYNIDRYKALKSQKNGIIGTFAVAASIVGVVLILFFGTPVFLIFILPVPFTAVPSNVFALYMMRKIRRQPIHCNECGEMMHILSEKHEDAHLKLAQQFEEQLHAVDYDVFVCGSCKNEAIFTLDKPSQYTPCPKCNTKAFILDERRITVAPTYLSPGNERLTYRCKYCGYEENDNHNLPRITRNSSAIVGGAVGGSLFSGSGGFGGDNGGGFGGGSFGGGMSGGGGSTSSW